MFKSFALSLIAGYASAVPGGPNGYARGIPPTTTNCKTYPTISSTWSTNFDSQKIAWGLVVDREFGGCRCADEDEMEFQPNRYTPADNTWACRCLNEDLYPSQPDFDITCKLNNYDATNTRVLQAGSTAQTVLQQNAAGTVGWKAPTGAVLGAAALADQWNLDTGVVVPSTRTWQENGTTCGGNSSDNSMFILDADNATWRRYELTTQNTMAQLNDTNGKKCGIIRECLDSAVLQQRTRWNEEAARALKTKEDARVYAKRSMMPDDEINRARRLRLKMTKENRMRARVQVAALSMKYRAVKNSMLTGSLDKSAFEKAYKLTARQIAQYRAQFASRQRDIEESWNLVVQRQRSAEAYIAADLQKIEEIYEQSLASIADRYGKRIAYFQSLPIIQNVARLHMEFDTTNFSIISNPVAFKNQWIARTVAGADEDTLWSAANISAQTNQQKTSICPIYEDGTAQL